MTPPAWCRLEEIAKVSLGLKSLQNDFFYVEPSTIKQYGLEPKFLLPVFRLKDLKSSRFLQDSRAKVQFLSCTLAPADLRGTGAWRYISAKARHPATRKKQTKGHQAETIQAVLERQSGKQWYSPKAVPFASNVWLRKAFGGVFAPLVFKRGGVCDQRCNAVRPKKGVAWEELAGIVTSSLFGLALESTGSSSLGGGALEVPTKRLRLVKVFDPRAITPRERLRLVHLAREVWESETPVDWSKGERPGRKLIALDEWLLKRMGSSVDVEKLYSDLLETCASRYVMAKEKSRSEKASTQVDLTTVAESIAEVVRPQMQAMQFPEAFIKKPGDAIVVDIHGSTGIVVRAEPMLTNISVVIGTVDGSDTILDHEYPRAVGEVLVRSMLLGRRRMTVPATVGECLEALAYLGRLLPTLNKAITEGCQASALGTRFESSIRKRTLEVLGLREEVFDAELPTEIALP